MQGQTLHLHSFSFPPSFLMGGASAPPGGNNMRHRCPVRGDHSE
nr:MAG TPA: hypothetical protein [Bacteriophage sp.]